MRYRYPDVLDPTGRTPRELGPVQIHVERVEADAHGSALAVIWLQCAFEPVPAGHLVIGAVPASEESRDERPVGRWPLPNLSGGAVVRWQLPFTIRDSERLWMRVECARFDGAERVREPWVLFETPDGLPSGPETPDVAAAIAGHALGPIGMWLIRAAARGIVEAGTRDPPPPARDPRPAALHVAVRRRQKVDGVRASLEVMWKPGQPLPAPMDTTTEPTAVRASQPREDRKSVV